MVAVATNDPASQLPDPPPHARTYRSLLYHRAAGLAPSTTDHRRDRYDDEPVR
jgi:hypothetical protein